MSCPQTSSPRRTGSFYGSLAYGSVVLTCYGAFLGDRTFFSSELMVPVVFALGAIHTALGILGGGLIASRGRIGLIGYYVLQCAILTGILVLSPSRGVMGILVLPLMSQSVFDLRARYAALVGLYLFCLNIGIWVIPFGWGAGREALMSYGVGFAFTICFTLITKRALLARDREEKLRQQVEEANAQLRASAAQSEELATTRERNRVAREIHDGVGHYLTVIKTQLDVAAALVTTQPEKARETLTKAAKLTADALDDVRRSVGSLRADRERPPLPEALRALTQEAGLPVTICIEGVARVLPPGVEHALFRSAQEGLTNIRKHAAASAAEVTLDFRPDNRVVLAVADNGRGRAEAQGTGFGLRGIRERIEILGGRVEADNRCEGGFSLTVEVPA